MKNILQPHRVATVLMAAALLALAIIGCSSQPATVQPAQQTQAQITAEIQQVQDNPTATPAMKQAVIAKLQQQSQGTSGAPGTP